MGRLTAIRTHDTRWTMEERTLDTSWQIVAEETSFAAIVTRYMAPRGLEDTRGYVARRILKDGRVITDETHVETEQLTLEGA